MGSKRSADEMEATAPTDATAAGDEAMTTYVSVELVDFAEFPILDKHETLEIEGLESETPILRIGDFTLYGVYEDAIGTDVFYDLQSSEKKTLHAMSKRLKFTIAPKDKEAFHKKTIKVV
ncbi:hypothetical protein SDRG_10402 [Saprolegnia diclina VS20]|uniref:Transcription factor TFIIIC triple barrel domain-containing protein n=1 Tax=Saprolegnia diclina (strain VS20) TaxID=1156394 RepID=T0Q225_SAPDV|nr:hypothetical protein SDRG_10402 [Saprolegnia diclina VS20]EQC31884.1 hypothetical protein SDRG_10402 [Saprolegnia diclina VS20]|eukprot:XP_008614612.1 hypothetical protein SDRG_10402 [Saprolegnia diclina VS20]